MKYNNAKRPEDFEGESNSKVPESFIAPPVKLESEVMETITPLPAATNSINLETVSATPLGGEEIIASLPSSYRESLFVPELIQEKKEEQFTYTIPENRRLKFRELCEHLEDNKKPKASDTEVVRELEVKLKKTDDHSWESIDSLMRAICKKHGISPKKLHDDFKDTHGVIPDVWVEKNVVKEEVKSPMQELAEMIPGDKVTTELNEEQKFGRVINLEKKVEAMRKMVLEMGQGTIVQGLGMGSPGSGEVRVNRMDDVESSTLEDGDVLVWDAEMQKWIPGQSVGTGFGDLIFKVSSIESKLFDLMQWVHAHSHDASSGAIDTRILLELEESQGSVTPGQTQGEATSFAGGPIPETAQFRDTTPDGDTTRFIVGVDHRGVYTLDGIAQPTVLLPRGDIIEFDVSNLDNPDQFDLFKNGELLETGKARFNDTNIVRLRTGDVATSITKVYYKNTQKNGLGWVIVITDN